MREIRQSGSVRGVRRNPYPYRDWAVDSGRLLTGNHALSRGRNLPRTCRANCGGNFKAAADFEHGDDVVDGNAIGQQKAGRGDIDSALGVVERIGFIGAARSKLVRQFRGVHIVCKPRGNPSPIILGMRVLACGRFPCVPA